MLSACETNVGPQLPLEAGVTLASGFLAAGARRVVASHWSGDDRSTAELMVAGTRQGLAPAQLLWVLTRVVPGLEVRKAGFLQNLHAPAMFAVRDLLKDLDLGLALYQPPVPLTFLARQLFAAVAARTPDFDISAILDEYTKENAG